MEPAGSVSGERGEREELQKPPCCCPSSAVGGDGGSRWARGDGEGRGTLSEGAKSVLRKCAGQNFLL